jgi:hypothetical protein
LSSNTLFQFTHSSFTHVGGLCVGFSLLDMAACITQFSPELPFNLCLGSIHHHDIWDSISVK